MDRRALILTGWSRKRSTYLIWRLWWPWQGWSLRLSGYIVRPHCWWLSESRVLSNSTFLVVSLNTKTHYPSVFWGSSKLYIITELLKHISKQQWLWAQVTVNTVGGERGNAHSVFCPQPQWKPGCVLVLRECSRATVNCKSVGLYQVQAHH